jgi:hypothetical protein
LVEDRRTQCGNQALNRTPALDPTLDRVTSVDWNPALDPTLDRIASVNPTFDGVETFDRQPPVERTHSVDEFPQPRLFFASAWKHTVAAVSEQPSVRCVPWRGWAEEIEVASPKFKRSRL